VKHGAVFAIMVQSELHSCAIAVQTY